MAWRSRALLVLLGGLGVLGAGCKDGGSGTGNAVAGFVANPEALDFGPTALGQPKTLDLQVVNSGRAPFKVLGITPSVGNVQVQDFTPFTLPGGDTRTLHVVFAPQAEGELHGVLKLDTDTGKGAGAQLKVAGVGVKAYAEVSNTGLDYSNVELNTAKMDQISVHNPTQVAAPVRVTLQGADADEFTAADAEHALTLAPGETRAVPVAFKPSRLGVAQATARVEVCQGCAPVDVSLTGSGIASKLEIDPGVLDFGRVPVGATDEETVTIRNLGTDPFDLQGAQLVTNPGGVYQITRQPAVGTLLPGASVQISVSFKPATSGVVKGGVLALGVVAHGASGPGPKMALSGEGGNSCVMVLPHNVDFGVVPEGYDATQRVDVYNRCQDDAVLSDFAINTTAGGYFAAGPGATSLTVAANSKMSLPITFTPKAGAGQSAALLAFKVNEGSATAVERVNLSGTGEKMAACDYQLDLQSLDFGLVPVGGDVSLGVVLTNVGTTDCYVSGMGLMSGSDPQYTAEDFAPQLVAPGKKAVLAVKFTPDAEGTFSGMAEAWVNNPLQRHPTVPLTGKGVMSCLSVAPTTADFGRVKLGCPVRTKTVQVTNNCAAAQTLSLGFAQGGSPDFTLDNPPSAATVMAAGSSRLFTLRYSPQDEGRDTGAFQVNVGQGPFTVGLKGRAELNPTQTDRFLQDNQDKVDVLFVVDNSGSMSEEQQGMAQNFAAFLSWAQQNGVDYHIGVTTTGIEEAPGGWAVCGGGANGGEAGRLFPVDGSSPRVITPSTPNAAAVFSYNVQVGICHWDEQGLEAAYRALSAPLVNNADDPRTAAPNDGNLGFLRDDAKLAVVFISDEDDSSGNTVSFYETFFKGLKGNNPSLLSMSAIVGPTDMSTCPTASSTGSRYIALANATGGVVDSICTPDWAASLEKLSRNAFGPKRSFKLSDQPGDPSRITVQVNGTAVTSGWSYDAPTNSVVFTSDAVPAAGAIIDVTYPLGCE